MQPKPSPSPSGSASPSPSPSPAPASGRNTYVPPSSPMAAASGGGQPWVWMPNQNPVLEYAPGYRVFTPTMNPGAMGASDASNYFWQMSEADRTRLSNLTGQFTGSSSVNPSTAQWAWNQAVAAAAAINQSNPSAKASPWDLLSKWAKSGGPGGGGSGGGGGGGPRTTTSSQTSRSVQKINAQQAKPILRQTLEALVGRSFSDDEVTKFVADFNAQAKKNPTVTRATSTTTTSGSSSSTSTSSTTSGGVDAGQIADEFARSRKDYAEYQVAVPLMQAFMQAIQSPEGTA